MKKIIVGICVLLAIVVCVYQFIILPYMIERLSSLFIGLDQYIEQEIRKQSSDLMRDEIIRQLKEKEGKTIQDYYIEDHFRRITE